MAQNRKTWIGIKGFFGLGAGTVSRPNAGETTSSLPFEPPGPIPWSHGDGTRSSFSGGGDSKQELGDEPAYPFVAEVAVLDPPTEPAAAETPLLSVARDVRGFTSEGLYEQAIELCETRLKDHPDFRDEWGHPAYYKEMLRLNLALGQLNEARSFSEKLRPLLPANDASVEILYARQATKDNDLNEARAAWKAVLERFPSEGEAVAWLEMHAA